MKKEYKHYLILIGTIIGIIILTKKTDFLFGSYTDWIDQHTIFPDYLRQLFYKTGNLFPNFAMQLGAGQNIYNISYYGLLNPIILFSYLLPHVKMIDYIAISSIISVIVSSCLFYKWMKTKQNPRIAFITSMIFTLSAPLIFHAHRHIMFINYIPFLLLALLGVDRYFEKQKRGLVTISTFLMILTSYYYSVGGILALLCYTVYLYLSKNKKVRIKDSLLKILPLIDAVIIGILLSGILLLPTMYTIVNSRINVVKDSILQYLIPNWNIDILLYSNYSIGLSVISIFSLIYMMTTKKKENLFLGGMILTILLFPIITYVLNGGLYIRSKVFIPFLPIICLMISIFLEQIEKRSIHLKSFLPFTLLCILLGSINYNQKAQLGIDTLLMTCTCILYYRYKKHYFLYIPILATSLFICYTTNQSENYIWKKEYDILWNTKVEQNIKKINEQDHSIYRFNNFLSSSINMNKVYGLKYYSTSIYSSTYHAEYQNFVKNIMKNPMPYRNYLMTGQSNNIFFETFMGIKYIMNSKQPDIGYELITNQEKINIYKNDYTFPLGYASSNLLNIQDFERIEYPYTLDYLLNTIITNQPTNTNYKSNMKPIKLDYQIEKDQNITIDKTNNGYLVHTTSPTTLKLQLKQPLKNKVIIIQFDGLETQDCIQGDLDITINDITNKLTCDWLYHNQNYTFEYVISNESI